MSHPPTAPAAAVRAGARRGLDPSALPSLVVPPPGPRSRAWLRRLKASEAPHITTVAADFPIVWRRARGAVVEDVDGSRYLDAGSSFGVALLGHGHPAVVRALRRQAGELIHGMGDVHPPTVRVALLEALAAIAPGDLGHGVLCTGGAEAVEVALQTALLATGRRGIVAFEGGYHGLSLGALAATERDDFRRPFAPWLPGPTTFVPYPLAIPADAAAEAAGLARTLAALDAALARRGPEGIGVVLVEPLQGRGGTRVPAAGLLPALRQRCDAAGALLALDEIFTGCGRTGKMFACEHEAVVPDLLCVGKALGGGMAVAACVGRPAAMAAWGEARGEALRTSTFLGHPMAAAAALAALRVVRRDDVPGQAATIGDGWRRALTEALATSPAVAEIRGRGLMWGVALRAAGGHAAAALAWRTVVGCLRRGVLVLPCGADGSVVQVTPPVVMTPAQRQAVVAALADALAEAQAGASAA